MYRLTELIQLPRAFSNQPANFLLKPVLAIEGHQCQVLTIQSRLTVSSARVAGFFKLIFFPNSPRMHKMYFLYFSIVVLAFIFSIFLITSGNRPSSEVGVGPVIQLVFALPILILSSALFFSTRNTALGVNFHFVFIWLPFILEIIYFLFTKDLFTIFESDNGAFLIRSYVYSIGLATITTYFFNWVLSKVF